MLWRTVLMEVFLSWSGDYSRELAEKFNKWLPKVIQNVTPFMSEKDLKLGSVWNDKINESLTDSIVGILFITPDNINSSWLNYEAGALSKTVDSESRIIPIVFGSDDPEILISDSPLKQFQTLLHTNETEIVKLVHALNANLEKPLSQDNLMESFQVWWPDLRDDLKKIDEKYREKIRIKKNEKKNGDLTEKGLSGKLLQQISENVDLLIRRSLSNPTSYRLPHQAVIDLDRGVERLIRLDSNLNLSEKEEHEYHSIVNMLIRPIRYLDRQVMDNPIERSRMLHALTDSRFLIKTDKSDESEEDDN